MDRMRLLRLGLRAGAAIACALGLLAMLDVAERLAPGPDVRLAYACDPDCGGQLGLAYLAGHALALLAALAGAAGVLARRRSALRASAALFLAAMSLLVADDVLMRAARSDFPVPEPQTLLGMLVLLPGVVLLAAYTYRDDAARRLRWADVRERFRTARLEDLAEPAE